MSTNQQAATGWLMLSLAVAASAVAVLPAQAGTPFALETVDATMGGQGENTSLTFDAQGNPRISYKGGINNDLKYAVKTGAAWSIEIADTTGDVGYDTSLALDAQGNPHISYYDNTNDDLMYAVKTNGGAIPLRSPTAIRSSRSRPRSSFWR